MEEPGRLQSMGSLRVGHDWVTSLWLFTFMHWRRKWQPTPVFLPGESQGRGSLVGCRLWGHTESDTTEATAAAAAAHILYKWLHVAFVSGFFHLMFLRFQMRFFDEMLNFSSNSLPILNDSPSWSAVHALSHIILTAWDEAYTTISILQTKNWGLERSHITCPGSDR